MKLYNPKINDSFRMQFGFAYPERVVKKRK